MIYLFQLISLSEKIEFNFRQFVRLIVHFEKLISPHSEWQLNFPGFLVDNYPTNKI